MNHNQRLTGTAVCIGLGVLLPMIFHTAGIMGNVFLPMHIPVLLAGLFWGCKSGVLTGLLAPVLSMLLTGMPPVMPILPVMAVELMLYGGVSGYLYQQKQLPLLWSLLLSMMIGRIGAGLTVYLMSLCLSIKITPMAYVYGSVVTGLPGVILQLVFIPLLAKRLLFVVKNNG